MFELMNEPYTYIFIGGWGLLGYAIHKFLTNREAVRQTEEMVSVLIEMSEQDNLDHSNMDEINELMKREYPLAMKDKELKSIKQK